MRLTALEPGVPARVRALSTAPATTVRLHAMGLYPGVDLQLATRGAARAHLLAIGASRIVIDASTAAQIEVEFP